MFTFIAVAKVFNGGEVDKNGKSPIVLQPLSGTSPRGLNVLSGTVAESQGFIPNKTYGVIATEREQYEGKRQFNFSLVGEVSTLDALSMATTSPVKLLIQPEVEEQAPPVGAEA